VFTQFSLRPVRSGLGQYTVSDALSVLVLQKQPDRLDVVHVVELQRGWHVATAEPCHSLHDQPLVENRDALDPLGAVAHHANLGDASGAFLELLHTLEKRLCVSAPGVHPTAESAEVVRNVLDPHDAAQGLDAHRECIGHAVDAQRHLAVDESHVARGCRVFLVTTHADVEQRAMLYTLHVDGELSRAYGLVLLLLELDLHCVEHKAALQVVHCQQLEQWLCGRRMQQLQAVEAAEARRPHGRREEALVDPVVFAAVVLLVHALHAAARAVAALDRCLRLALEACEVEVLMMLPFNCSYRNKKDLDRVDAEVVDDVAHEQRHAAGS
jgi:hypothetical protein